MNTQQPKKILIQLDSDQHPSVFDSVVALDAGIDQLLPYSAVEPIDVPPLVHGAMFTRGGSALRHTAIFIGGSRVQSAEQILRAVKDTFFGPVRVSVMLDANGANTTAAAAVLCLRQHLQPAGKTVGVLAATGSVGSRIARLLGQQGALVRVASRDPQRAEALCQELRKFNSQMQVTPAATEGLHDYDRFLEGCDAILAAGAAGVQLLRQQQWQDSPTLRVAIDLNAVPPAGIEGIDVVAAGSQVGDKVVYGAVGVGDLKMKIHKRCLVRLFESHDQILDIEEIYRLGEELKTGPNTGSR